MRRLIPDGAEVLDIVEEQLEHLERRKYRKVIRIGDHWRGQYLHVPQAMLLDAWSASAEFALRRFQLATLRLLRADMHFRKWERLLTNEKLELETGERDFIAESLEHFTAVLTRTCQKYGYTDFQYRLLEEYERKIGTFQE